MAITESAIRAAVATRLATISTSAAPRTPGPNYSMTVAHVDRVLLDHEEAKAGLLPLICVAPATNPINVPRYRAGNRMRMWTYMDINVIREGLPGQPIQDALEAAADDVIACMHADSQWTVGGVQLAIETKLFAGPVYTSADADAKHRGGRGMALMVWGVEYDRGTGKTA